MTLHDPFNRIRGFDRADRIRMLREVANALMDGRAPSPKAATFVASGLLAWLGGEVDDLLRDAWKVAAPRGSHLRPAVIARRLIADDERESEREADSRDIDNDDAELP